MASDQSSIVETKGDKMSRDAIRRLEDYTVVDCDVHEINVKYEEYAKYVDDPWKSRLKHIGKTDEPLAGTLAASSAFDIEASTPGLGDDVKTTTAEGIKSFMDRLNTDYVLLHGHEHELLYSVPEREWAGALCRAYNDFVLDRFVDEEEGLLSSIRVPMDAPEQAVEEIERLKDEKAMVSVHPAGTATQKLLGDDYYWPIYEAAEDAGLPIDFHVPGSSTVWNAAQAAPKVDGLLQGGILGIVQCNMSHVASMIFQGLPEQFPDLEYVFLEQGLAWIPWAMGRMDKNYERRRHTLSLEKKPSEYLRDKFYFGTQPMETSAGPRDLKKIIEMIGYENIMYSSDFPHFDFDYPSMLTIPSLSEDAERKVFGETALDVLDI